MAMSQAKATTITRAEWCKFYRDGKIIVEMQDSSVFQKGDRMTDIGYWDLMYDQLGPEGFSYTADGNGYSSNGINWNSAVAVQSNNEFVPGSQYKTFTTGHPSICTTLFAALVQLAKKNEAAFKY